jgi:hypothetical protein
MVAVPRAAGFRARGRPWRPRVLVQTLRVTAIPLVEKSAGATPRVRRLEIAGAPAVFLEGTHGFELLDERGEARCRTAAARRQHAARRARRGPGPDREGDLPLASAVVVARSME